MWSVGHIRIFIMISFLYLSSLLSANNICMHLNIGKNMTVDIFMMSMTTADSAVYIILGTIPVEGTIHKQALTFHGNICRLDRSSVTRVFSGCQGLFIVWGLLNKRLFYIRAVLDYSSVEQQLAERQLPIKTTQSNRWFVAVQKITVRYELPDLLQLLPVIFFTFWGLVPVPVELGKIVAFFHKLGKIVNLISEEIW